ncbi:hypothetical protein E2C01_093127 [Portunus trituberculatus]|uniref:Uncharacterized protein n=1 Tax=Portunus trituberculatus TaxID=210409 RepID=A0A5B7JT75_PORTR|nr:hypothetical protein [Portunus trituberculatus]
MLSEARQAAADAAIVLNQGGPSSPLTWGAHMRYAGAQPNTSCARLTTRDGRAVDPLVHLVFFSFSRPRYLVT